MKRVLLFISVIVVVLSSSSYTPHSQNVMAETEVNKTVYLGGEPFGIKMFSDGVLVINVERTLYGTDVPSPASISGIKANDIIKKVNGITMESNEHFTELVTKSNQKELVLTIERNGEIKEINVTPKYDLQGNLRLGIWIKDSAAGIGTITYYDAETSTFAALGHGICESQTGKLIPLSYGEIAKANINDIVKSKNGSVGALNGYFEGEIIGEAYKNCENGIFGNLYSDYHNDIVEIAEKHEVKNGNAEIYCTIDGSEKKKYEIKIRKNSYGNNNSMLIEITDPELLEKTGGIVQGMSGSPIVQNGKLVGAVTHVLVNNVKCGYGIYIEDMINS